MTRFVFIPFPIPELKSNGPKFLTQLEEALALQA